METISEFCSCELLKENQIIISGDKCKLENTTILFRGKNNILYVEDGVQIVNSSLTFSGDNAVVFLGSNCHKYFLNVNANNDTCIYIGRNNYINGKLTIIASERKNIIIGDDGLISYGVCFRTADPHLIYDVATKKRINLSKSILVGDHVWIGQNALILKGTVVGSGVVLGAGGCSQASEFLRMQLQQVTRQELLKKIFFSLVNVFTTGNQKKPYNICRWMMISGYMKILVNQCL